MAYAKNGGTNHGRRWKVQYSILKYSYNWPHQYAMEKPERGGRWRELRLFPFGSMAMAKMCHNYNVYEGK